MEIDLLARTWNFYEKSTIPVQNLGNEMSSILLLLTGALNGNEGGLSSDLREESTENPAKACILINFNLVGYGTAGVAVKGLT